MTEPRPTRDQILIAQAEIVAQRSTCSRAQVGVVIAHESRVVAQGYNGTPAGMTHCDHACDCGANEEGLAKSRRDHQRWCIARVACKAAVHAEANAIAFAAKYGVSTNGAHLYTTMAPCLPCSQLVVNCGIVRVVYVTPYRYEEGIQLLMEAGIPVTLATPTLWTVKEWGNS